MPKMPPPDIRGVPWPFDGEHHLFPGVDSDDYQVLIEGLSDHFFLLKELRHSPEYDADIECQVVTPSQKDIQSSPEVSAFDWKYPRQKFGCLIERPPTATLDDNPWPWIAAQETSQPELSYSDSSDEYPLEGSILNGLLKMLDNDVEAGINLTLSSSTDYGTLISHVNDFSGSSHWTKSASPISGYSDTNLDYPCSYPEEYRPLDHIFSPRPYTMPFPVVTVKTPPEEEFFCQSPESNHLLFPSSIADESCYGMLLSPSQSSIDSLPCANSRPAPLMAPVILTPKPGYPLPTWFY